LKFDKEEENELIERKIGLRYALKSIPVARLHVRLGEKCGKFLLLKSGEDKFERTDEKNGSTAGRNPLPFERGKTEKGHSGNITMFPDYGKLLRPAGKLQLPFLRIDVSNLSINVVGQKLEKLNKEYAYVTIKRDPTRDVTEILCYAVYPKVR